MCGHRLADAPASVSRSDLSPGIEAGVRDEGLDDGVTLSYVSASTPAAEPVCEICGRSARQGETLCGACAELTATSEHDDG